MRVVLFALIMSICPALAEAKTWVDVECSRVLISAGDERQFVFQGEDKALTTCQIANWPINTPVAEMVCASGLSPKMELVSDRTLILDGVEMNLYTGPLPCGAQGAEWPD